MIHASKRMTRRARVGALALAVMAAVLVAVQVAPNAQAATSPVVFDDMEHGDPFANGWFAFDGDVGGGGITPNDTDLPPTLGGAYSLETGWGSGGTPGFYGGFGRTNPTDLTGTDYFNFWINPDIGQDYTLEINLQEDDNGDDAATPADDDEFQFNCVISAAGPCAESGAGWQFVSIPLADFFDDNSFFTGGNGVLDAVPAPAGNGQLINVVVAVIGTGSDVNFRTDYWAFSEGPLAPAAPTIIDDFENGLPSGTDGNGIPIGFFTFSDGSPVSVTTTDTPPAPVPDSTAGNNVLALTGDVVAFAGVIHAFENAAVDTWVPQDWSGSEGMSFWLYGLNTGTTLFIDVIDNRNPGSTTDDGERFTVSLIDDFAGWQLFEFPFSSFTRKEIGNGAPNDGFTLTEVHGWALGTLDTPGELTYYMDDVALYGVAEIPELAVSFTLGKYLIEEGTTGDVTVKLNRAMGDDDPAAVSVDYATEPATADPNRDYTPTSGTLTFTNGGPQELSFPLETFDNSKFTGDKRVTLRLSNPVDAGLGAIFQASALITDNDPYDPDLIDDFERGDYLWDSAGLMALSTAEIEAATPSPSRARAPTKESSRRPARRRHPLPRPSSSPSPTTSPASFPWSANGTGTGSKKRSGRSTRASTRGTGRTATSSTPSGAGRSSAGSSRPCGGWSGFEAMPWPPRWTRPSTDSSGRIAISPPPPSLSPTTTTARRTGSTRQQATSSRRTAMPPRAGRPRPSPPIERRGVAPPRRLGASTSPRQCSVGTSRLARTGPGRGARLLVLRNRERGQRSRSS